MPVDEDVSMAIESADYQSLLISIGMQPPSDMVRNIIINSVLMCLQGMVNIATFCMPSVLLRICVISLTVMFILG